MDAIEIVAHRGSSLLAPENTLAAAKLAWQEGADAVEGDFRLSADGNVVCIHDADLRRTGGIDRQVIECSLNELKSFDVGSWKGPQFADERIPTLGELLATVPVGKEFFVEVKCGAEIIEPLRRAIQNSSVPPHHVVLISLSIDVCAALKPVLPDCPVYWVVDFKQDRFGSWQPIRDEFLFEVAKSRDFLDGFDLMAGGPLDASLIASLKSDNRRAYVWTVDDLRLAQRLIEMGVDGITTNRPGWLRQQLRG